MTNDFRTDAKKLSEALRTVADVLGNERVATIVNKLANDPKEHELSKKDLRAYFASNGVELPASAKVESSPKPESLAYICVTWVDAQEHRGHGICIEYDKVAGIIITSWKRKATPQREPATVL